MKKYILFLIAIVLLIGCQKEALEPVEKENVEIGEPQAIEEIILTKEEQTEILKDYYRMLSSKNTNEEIIKLVDENAPKLDASIVDEMILSLEDYLMLSNPSIKDLSETLIRYREYSSDELKSYLDILNIEGQKFFTDGESMIIDLMELIDRAIKTEKHLRTYPNGKTMSKVKKYYSAYIYATIQGAGNQYIYAEEGSSKIKEDVLSQYKEVILNYPDFNLGKIFKIYIDTLALDENDLNGENVLEFYKNLDVVIAGNSNF